MDEIEYYDAGRLWIGRIHDVRLQPTGHLDVVVSVCQDTCRSNVGCRYEHFNLADGEQSAERWGGSYEYEDFERAADFLERYLCLGRNVCIHCHHGTSRSVSVAAAALGSMLDLSLYDSLALIYQYHPRDRFPDGVMLDHASRYIDDR